MIDVINFYKKRVLRIVPLFILASALLIFIGLNESAETIKGVFGISMLWKPAPATLWFVSMLLLFYFVTPLLISRKWWKQIVSGILVMIFILCIDYVWHSVDKRLYFYFLIYWVGICFAIHKHQIFSFFPKNFSFIVTTIYIINIGAFFLFANKFLEILLGVGIVLVFLISYKVSKLFNNSALNLINVVSYGSMCSYLFHRVIYWGALQFYIPKSTVGIWLYLLFVAFPFVIFSGYYIQKIYDNIICLISNKK